MVKLDVEDGSRSMDATGINDRRSGEGAGGAETRAQYSHPFLPAPTRGVIETD